MSGVVQGALWKVRALLESDLWALQEIVFSFYSHLATEPVGGGWTESQLKDECRKSHSLAAIYQPFGLVAFVLWQELPGGKEIRLLGAHPQWRRRGVTEDLMRLVMRPSESGEEIWLEVHEGNVGARNLYEKLGFSLVGKRPSYYRDGAGAWLYSWCCP